MSAKTKEVDQDPEPVITDLDPVPGDVVLFYVSPGKTHPAHVQSVRRDGSLHLWVMDEMSIRAADAVRGEEPGCWTPRVP